MPTSVSKKFEYTVTFQEYIQDGIDWAKVEFDDNQDCLNLFEKVPSFSSFLSCTFFNVFLIEIWMYRTA